MAKSASGGCDADVAGVAAAADVRAVEGGGDDGPGALAFRGTMEPEKKSD